MVASLAQQVVSLDGYVFIEAQSPLWQPRPCSIVTSCKGGGETSNGLDTAMYIDTCGMHAQSHTSRRLQEESYRTKEKEKELVS